MDVAGPRILIADDDPTARRLLKVWVHALGCEAAMASDGWEALGAIQHDLPALMLLGLEMPRMGGMEVLRALRREGLDLPVIVITAHGSIEAAVEAMKEGAYDFLPKPFDPKHLEIVIRKALEHRRLLVLVGRGFGTYSAARNLGYTFARAASFARKALGLAGHAASPRPSPRTHACVAGTRPRGAGHRPSSDSPPDCAVPGDLSPILRTAQYGRGRQPIPARLYSPEKEGVTHHRVGYGEMGDSCIPPPFDLPTRSMRPC